ncbi:MAG: hypothetical protein AB1777_11710 [Bacteroidota bacterium]
MRKFINITLLSLSCIVASGQNLVRNAGFEKYFTCPDNYTVEYTKRFIPDWMMPTKGTPDYFNRCSKEMVGVPQNFMGSIFPTEGNGFVGLVLLDTPDVKEEIDFRDYVHSGPLAPVTITNANIKKPDTRRTVKPINYREYLQTHLITPLQPNQLYRISFKYALAQHSTFVSNRLGIVFTQNPIKQKDGVLPYKPNAFIDTVALFATPGIWVELADTFRTSGGELYMTIGNFYDDKQTQYFSNDISGINTTLQRTILTNQLAYYYIDDVRLEPVKAADAGLLSPRFVPFSMLKHNELSKIDTIGRFFALLDEVFFDIGQPGTKPRSLCQLDGLIGYIQHNPNLGIELNGLIHEVETDTVGANSRLNAMKQFLIDSGIAEGRIKLKVLDDFKSISPKYRFYREGLPCVYYSSLIAIRFF